MKPEFMELPAQAFKCRLEQLDVMSLVAFSPDVIEKFCELTVEKELVAMIGSFDKSNQQYLISMNDTSKGNTEDVFELIAPLMPQKSSKEVVVPKQEVKSGKKEHVCVTTVTGVSNFYCQLMCSAAHLDDLMFNMDAHYKALSPEQEQLCQPKVGSYCVGQYTEDDSWYRAKITGINENMFEVLYIDFGNGETLPATRIKKLSQIFSQLPQQGVSCSLAGDNTGFSDSQFIELTLDKMFDMEVVSVENDDKTKVELYLNDTKRLLREQLTEAQKPILKIKPSPLKVGMTESVFVALASSLSKFYCQLTESADSLTDVMDKMYDYYENLGKTQDGLANPKVGSFCAAKFGEDDGWYRAMVSGVYGNSVEVFYVDFANSEVLSLERVKTLKSDFVGLPAQAIQCRLSNAKVITDAVSIRFLELVSDPEITYEVKVISITTDGVFDVELTRKESGESIYQILITEGLLKANG
jgi:tudor domain-containing protein 1/4/6/7